MNRVIFTLILLVGLGWAAFGVHCQFHPTATCEQTGHQTINNVVYTVYSCSCGDTVLIPMFQ